MTDKANILMVDDQPARLLTYESILEELGHNLVRASSGTEALQCLMKMEFAAILLDVSMPDMDGFETAAMIHQHPRFEKTPIIFVTAVHVTDMDRLRGYEMGAVDYVYVPVIPEVLRGKVQVLVELYLQRRELQRLNQSLALANQELTAAHQALQAERTRELQQLNQTLADANAELEQTNQTLTAEIAERKRAQQALQTEARRKDEFLAILAHELRNPLSAIHNGVQLMHLGEISDPNIVMARDLLGRQVKHLTRLIDDLLDISRITTGRIQLQREPVNLATVVARAVEATQPLMQSRRHHLSVKLSPEPIYVEGDLVRLTQVVDNLLANAAKYTDEGGLIEISMEILRQDKAAAAAVIRIRDNGIGIPPQMLDQIFELFTQANPTFDRVQAGLGIGLALVRSLVNLHGGRVQAVSEGPGKGSEFTVQLPLRVAPVEIRRASVAASANAGSPGLCILVVDDNIDSIQALALWLKFAGHKVELAHAGDTGLEMALKLRPDAVLLDIGLPGLNGYEVAQRLREQEAFKTVPLIAMTGFSGKADRQRAIEAGFDHYLVKPIDYQTLRNMLSALTPSAVTAG